MDMRYVGQNYELPVLINYSSQVPVLPDQATLIEAFFKVHQRSYGYVDRKAPVEVMNVRLKAVLPLGQTAGNPKSPQGNAQPEVIQDVWFTAETASQTPVYRRDRLPAGTKLTGPAIITQFDATTVVPADTTLVVDDALNLILDL